MIDATINIRAIQHYMYCPRRFALLEINNDWSENAFVVKANIMHENVHSGSHNISSEKLVAKSSVTLYNDDLDIFGVADCVEFVQCSDGTAVDGLNGKYKIKIVEYKPKTSDNSGYNETDAIQVFAQKMCADYIWGCDSEGYIYYSETRKRIRLPFDNEKERYMSLLEKYLSEMREILRSGTIPQKRKGQKCSGCSMSDICFSKNIGYSVRKEILSTKGEP